MSKGRRDYTSGMVTDSYSLGRFDTNFHRQYEKEIAAGANAEVGEYIVGSANLLYLTGFSISSYSPSPCRVVLWRNNAAMFALVYELEKAINLHEYGCFAFGPDDKLEIYVLNNDEIPVTFYATITGVLEATE